MPLSLTPVAVSRSHPFSSQPQKVISKSL